MLHQLVFDLLLVNTLNAKNLHDNPSCWPYFNEPEDLHEFRGTDYLKPDLLVYLLALESRDQSCITLILLCGTANLTTPPVDW